MENFDFFNYFDSNLLGEYLLGFGVLFLIYRIIYGIFAIVVYVLQGLGLKNLAEKNNLPNSWLAFIPGGNMYLLGKLGFEIYAPSEKKDEIFTWILLGCSIGTIILSDSDLEIIANIGLVVFSSWSYYYIFNKINPKNSVLYTILNEIFGIGGVLLFFNSHRFNKENVKVNNTKNEVNEEKKETEKSPKYCAYCGNKLNENSKFCSKCGAKI